MGSIVAFDERNIVNTAVNNSNSLVVTEIQVSGGECFEGRLWRDAITTYLFGMWKDDVAVTHRPKIALGDVTLRLVGDSYVLYGESTPDSVLAPHVSGELLIAHGGQSETEIALMKFVKNNKIRRLCISLGEKGTLILSKGASRGELLAWATLVPSTQEMMDRLLPR